MAHKLQKEEIVTLHVLHKQGQSNSQIAQILGVTEGAVRYHLRRQGTPDGRQHKPKKAQAVAEAIDHWVQSHNGLVNPDRPRPVNVRALYDWLCGEHDYLGSYKSVLRFVRARNPKPKIRPFRRVETPPGAQAQVDWGHFHPVHLDHQPQTLYGFVLVLSYSRKEILIWTERMDQLAWHHAHNEAFRRLGGVPAVLRIDNLKTGIVRGAGPWGQINEAYRSYARNLRFHIDACLPRAPEDKGKVENKVGTIKRRLRVHQHLFADLEELQSWTDEQLQEWTAKRLCPATGESVERSWHQEQALLGKLPPVLPMAFDIAMTRPVYKDCTVSFEGRTYSVSFRLCGQHVEVRGCCQCVQILHDNQVVAEHARGTPERIVINTKHYEGQSTETVAAPVPLGKLGRKLQDIVAQPVEQRPLDLYAALAEVAR